MATATISGFAAFGTEIQVDSGTTTPSFVTIEGVGDITGPSSAMGEAEITSHSTGIPVRQFLPTLADPGELSFPCFWDPSDPTQGTSTPYGLETMFWAKTIGTFRQVYPDPGMTAYEFSGYVKQLAETAPISGIATRTTVIRIIGQRQLVTLPLGAAMRPVSAYVGAQGGSRNVLVKAPADKQWKAQPDQDWLKAPKDSYTGGGAVAFNIAPNTTGKARHGIISIPELELKFQVQQAA